MLLLPLKAKWHPTKAKRVGLPGRGRLACGPPGPAFRSPTLLLLLLVKKRSRMVAVLGALAAAGPESLSVADAVERRQADVVRLDGEEEGDEEEESELEAGEVVDKQQGSGKGGEGLPPRAPRERLHWPPKGSEDLEHGPPMTA